MSIPALLSIPGLVSSLLLWGALIAFTHTIPHTPHAKRWMLAAVPVLFVICHIKMEYGERTVLLLLGDLACLVWCAFIIYKSTKLDAKTSVYCAVWVDMITLLAYELWLIVRWVANEDTILSNTQLVAAQCAFTGAIYLSIRFTLVETLPLDGKAKVGPRQLGCALVLWGLFAVQFHVVMDLYYQGYSFATRKVLALLVIQLYCPVALSMQNSLFMKSAITKELETITMLYERQRSQYQTARRNVQLIYKRCHDLKLQLAAVKEYLPEDFSARNWSDTVRAVNILDRCVHTGSEVLDTVLTEKALDCETKSISINTVADGKILDFMDPADLYALFAGILDGLIGVVSKIEDVERRQVDVMVVQRQGFAVIHIIAALRPEELPPDEVRNETAEHKVIEKIVKKYDGVFSIAPIENGVCTKVVLPLKA